MAAQPPALERARLAVLVPAQPVRVPVALPGVMPEPELARVQPRAMPVRQRVPALELVARLLRVVAPERELRPAPEQERGAARPRLPAIPRTPIPLTPGPRLAVLVLAQPVRALEQRTDRTRMRPLPTRAISSTTSWRCSTHCRAATAARSIRR